MLKQNTPYMKLVLQFGQQTMRYLQINAMHLLMSENVMRRRIFRLSLILYSVEYKIPDIQGRKKTDFY